MSIYVHIMHTHTHSRAFIQMDSINCTTSEPAGLSPPMSGPVMVFIDSATVNNTSVQFTYTLNPELVSVTPSETILA